MVNTRNIQTSILRKRRNIYLDESMHEGVEGKIEEG